MLFVCFSVCLFVCLFGGLFFFATRPFHLLNAFTVVSHKADKKKKHDRVCPLTAFACHGR